MLVYVLNKNEKILMPCKAVKARILLKQGKAKVIQKEPFTIQILYGSSGYKQNITLGVDAGAKHIGLSASTKQKELYSADVELRTNIVETASFDIHKIKNSGIQGSEYQQGEQLGFWNVREYVLFRDGHTYQHCHGKNGDKALNVHHIESRKIGGNAPNNLITLCETCHSAYHAGKIKPKQKRGHSFKEAAFMGIMRWALFEKLKEIYPNVQNTYGYITKNNRIRLGLPKEHYVDAFCIAGNFEAERLSYYWYQKQVRKHNRQIHKIKYIKGGIRKRNQTPYMVFGFRLFDKVRYSGRFYLKKLDGMVISGGVTYKKLKLIAERKTFITERREVAPHP